MRPIKQNEIELIKKMTEGHFEIPNYVIDMKDGKMGSISFDIKNDRSRFKKICSAQYIDSDDILIDIELTIDENEKLFELDFWKVDFSPLKVYPTPEKLNIKSIQKNLTNFMATQTCPKCQEDSFTWFIDDNISELTIWICNSCNYEAFENESDEKCCIKCEKKTESKLKDKETEYWWCFNCNAKK